MDKETWKDVIKFKGYYKVSSFGRIKSLERTVPHKRHGTYTLNEKILKSRIGDSGYLRLSLNKNNDKYRFVIHRLVAEAFLPNPLNYTQVNHKDGNKTNNHVNNLHWCDNKYNSQHAAKLGLHPNSILNERKVRLIRFMLKYFDFSQKDIGVIFKVARKTIGDIVQGNTWSHVRGTATTSQIEEWIRQNKQEIKDKLNEK